MLKATVPMEEDPPVTDVGLNVKLDTAELAAVPQTPGVPPPTPHHDAGPARRVAVRPHVRVVFGRLTFLPVR